MPREATPQAAATAVMVHYHTLSITRTIRRSILVGQLLGRATHLLRQRRLPLWPLTPRPQPQAQAQPQPRLQSQPQSQARLQAQLPQPRLQHLSSAGGYFISTHSNGASKIRGA